jgi:hypothetical protein
MADLRSSESISVRQVDPSVINFMIPTKSESDFHGGELLISVEGQSGGCGSPAAAWPGMRHYRATELSRMNMKVGHGKGRKVGKPRGKTCRWTEELDEVLRTAWARGGLRAARRAIRQYQPTWSRYSVKKRAAFLKLCRRRAHRWTDADENHLLWSIDSNASLALIAERLGRTVAAVRKRLRDLDYTAESLGGFKVKDVADMFAVPPARVQYWVAEKLLLTKGGRITDSSVSKFLADHPERIPFEGLSVDMQNWLREMGYPDRASKQKAAGVDNE